MVSIDIKSKKDLEIILSRAPSFPNPKIELEQYPIESRLAAEILWFAYLRGYIENRCVADYGCGTGILSLGAALLGANQVLCIDIDCETLSIAIHWFKQHGVDDVIDIVCSDVNRVSLRHIETIVMNPPFGVKRHGADIEFLKSAFRANPYIIISVHKFNEYSHRLIIDISKQFGYELELLFIDTMAIPQIYERHVKRIHRFKVGVYVFKRG